VPIRRLALAAAVEAPMVTPGGAGPAQAGWHPHGCTRPDADGLSLCRQLAFAAGREAAPALVAMLPEVELPRRLLTQYATGTAGWLMLAPGLRGVCYLGETCRLRFAVVGGRELEVAVPAEPVVRWRDIRDEAARLLRDAAGLDLARDPALPF
jgi:hypothetical protein